MIEYSLDKVHSILFVTPLSLFEESDFLELAKVADPYIEKTGDLNALIIDTPKFPGWENFAAAIAHFQFIRDHQKHIKKVALVTDSAIGNMAEHLASHFISAKIKHFSAGQIEAATQWAIDKQ